MLLIQPPKHLPTVIRQACSRKFASVKHSISWVFKIKALKIFIDSVHSNWSHYLLRWSYLLMNNQLYGWLMPIAPCALDMGQQRGGENSTAWSNWMSSTLHSVMLLFIRNWKMVSDTEKTNCSSKCFKQPPTSLSPCKPKQKSSVLIMLFIHVH